MTATVSQIMDADPQSVGPEDSVETVVQRMHEQLHLEQLRST